MTAEPPWLMPVCGGENKSAAVFRGCRGFFFRCHSTYRAALAAGWATLGPRARLAQTFAADLNVEVEGSIGGGRVAEDGQEGGAIAVHSDTDNDWSPVAARVGVRGGRPNAAFLLGAALVVDIVLSGGWLALPLEVGVLVRVGQGDGSTGVGESGNDHGLGAGIICPAGSDLVGELILDDDTAHTRLAELSAARAAQFEVAVRVAVQATNGLAGGALAGWPLSLLVAVGASIRAEGIGLAGGASNTADDVADGCGAWDIVGNLLNARPAVLVKPGDGNGAVVAGELTAGDLAAGEVGIDTGTSRSRGRLRGGGRGRRGGSGRWRRGGSGRSGPSRGGGRRGRSRRGRRGGGGRGRDGLKELGAHVLGGGGLGRWRRVRRRGFANDHVLAVFKALLGLLGVEKLAGELPNSGGRASDVLGHDVGVTLFDRRGALDMAVVVLVVAVEGGGSASDHGCRQRIRDQTLHGRVS